MTTVTIQHVQKAYEKGKPVLSNIDVRIGAGEMFFLLGPSGCGKTTLLRLIAGFLQPDDGQILFDEQDVTSLPTEARETALVFQNYALWPHMTVLENVLFGLQIKGIDSKTRKARAMEALEVVGLVEFANRRVPALSGGQQQRVALARAIVVRPKVLLLDEPLSNLDAKLRQLMRSELRRICKEAGLTSVYVTHEQKEALSMADRIAVMHGGIMQQVGTPREIYLKPANRFVAEFVGDINRLPAEVTQVDGASCQVTNPFGEFRARVHHQGFNIGDKAQACIRPEALAVQSGITQGENSFEAEIIGITYLGEIGQLDLNVQDFHIRAFELHPPMRAVGEMVTCFARPEDLFLLPAEGDG